MAEPIPWGTSPGARGAFTIMLHAAVRGTMGGPVQADPAGTTRQASGSADLTVFPPGGGPGDGGEVRR